MVDEYKSRVCTKSSSASAFTPRVALGHINDNLETAALELGHLVLINLELSMHLASGVGEILLHLRRREAGSADRG